MILFLIGHLCILFILLQTWFYEKFRVDHIDRTISYLQRDKPLIQYWNDAKAGKVDKIISQNYVGVGQVYAYCYLLSSAQFLQDDS